MLPCYVRFQRFHVDFLPFVVDLMIRTTLKRGLKAGKVKNRKDTTQMLCKNAINSQMNEGVPSRRQYVKCLHAVTRVV